MAKTDTSDPFTSTDFSTPDSSSIIPGGVSTGYETTPVIQDMERPKLTNVTTNEKTDLDEAYSSLERAMRLRYRADQLKRKQRLAQSFPTIQSYADLTKSIQGYDDLPYREKDKIYQQYMDGVSKMLDDYNEGRTVRTGKIDKNKFLEAFQTANPAPDKPDRTFMELLGDIGVRLASGVVTTPAALSTMMDVVTGEAQSDTTKALYDQVKQLNDAQSAKAKDTAKELEFDKMMLQNDDTRSAVSKFFGEIGLTLTHMSPESIAELAGNILPSVGLQTLVGTTARAVSARIIAKQALAKVGEKSLALGTAAAGKLSAKAAADVAARAGKIAGTTSLGFAAALNSIMSGGDAANTAYEHVMGMTDKELRALPDYAEKYAQYNGDEKAIRDSYARDGMQVAAAIGSVVGLGGALSPLSMERGIGKAVAGRGGAILSSLAGAVTGAFEEGATQVAGNIGGRYAGADVNLMEGVAEAATQGLIGEGMGTMGGALAARMGRRRMMRGLNEAFTVPEVTAPGEQLSPIQQAIQQRSQEAYAIQTTLTNPDVQLGENARNQLLARYERLVREAERLQQQHRMSNNPGEEAPIDFVREAQQDTQTEYQDLAKEMEFMLNDPNSNLNEAERNVISRGLLEVNKALGQMTDGNFEGVQTKIEAIRRAEDIIAEKAKPNTEGKDLIAQYQRRVRELQEREQAGDIQAGILRQVYQTRLEDLQNRHARNPNFIPNPEDALPALPVSAEEGITEHENLIKRIDEQLAKLDKNSKDAIQLERAKTDAQNTIQELQTKGEYNASTDKLPSVLEAENILRRLDTPRLATELTRVKNLISNIDKTLNDPNARLSKLERRQLERARTDAILRRDTLSDRQKQSANGAWTGEITQEESQNIESLRKGEEVLDRISRRLPEGAGGTSYINEIIREAEAALKEAQDANDAEAARAIQTTLGNLYNIRAASQGQAPQSQVIERAGFKKQIDSLNKLSRSIQDYLTDTSKPPLNNDQKEVLNQALKDIRKSVEALEKQKKVKGSKPSFEPTVSIQEAERIVNGEQIQADLHKQLDASRKAVAKLEESIAKETNEAVKSRLQELVESERKLVERLEKQIRTLNAPSTVGEMLRLFDTLEPKIEERLNTIFDKDTHNMLERALEQIREGREKLLNDPSIDAFDVYTEAINQARNIIEDAEINKSAQPRHFPTDEVREAPIRPEETKPQAPEAATTETAPEAKPEAKPETKQKAKPETKLEAKPETKPETKPEAKPETKQEAKPETKLETTTKKPATPSKAELARRKRILNQRVIKKELKKDSHGNYIDNDGYRVANADGSSIRSLTELREDVKNGKLIQDRDGYFVDPKTNEVVADKTGRPIRAFLDEQTSLDVEKVKARINELEKRTLNPAESLERARLKALLENLESKKVDPKTARATINDEALQNRNSAKEDINIWGELKTFGEIQAALDKITIEIEKARQQGKDTSTLHARVDDLYNKLASKRGGINDWLSRAFKLYDSRRGKKVSMKHVVEFALESDAFTVKQKDLLRKIYAGFEASGLPWPHFVRNEKLDALGRTHGGGTHYIEFKSASTPRTLIHELFHSFTVTELHKLERAALRDDKAAASKLGLLQYIFDYVKNTHELDAYKMYGMSDIKELYAELISNPNTAEILRNTIIYFDNIPDRRNVTFIDAPVTLSEDVNIKDAIDIIKTKPNQKSTSVWSALVNWLKNICNISAKPENQFTTYDIETAVSAYDALVNASDTFLESPPRVSAETEISKSLPKGERIIEARPDSENLTNELISPLKTPQEKQNAAVQSLTRIPEKNRLTIDTPTSARTQEYVNTQIERNQSVEGVEPKLTEVARTQGQKGVMNWIKNTFGKAAESAYEHFGDAAIKQRRWLENIGDMRPELNPIAQRVDDAFYAVEGRTDHYANLMYGHGNQAVNAVNELARTMKADPKKIAQDVGWYMTAKFAPEAQARLMRQMEQQIAAARVACLKDPDNASLQKVRDSLLDTYFKTQQEMDGEVNAKLTMPLAGGMNTATANNIVNILESRYGKDKLDSVTKHIYDMNAMRLAVAIETGQTLPKTAVEFLEKPQLLQQLEDHAALARNPQVDERTLRKSRKAVMDAVRSEYVPLTGDPTASLDIDEMTAPGNGRRNPNTPADKRMGGRVTVANNGWDASLESAQKTAKFGGWKPYADRVADLHAAMTESERQEAGFGRKELTRQDLTPQSSIVIRDLTKNRAYAYSMPDEVMTAVKQANTEQVSAVLKPLAWATHKLGYGWTQLRVQFAPINMWKDVWERGVNLKARFPELEGLQGAIWKNVIDPELFKATYNFATGRENNGSLASLRLAELDRFGALITKSNYFALSKQGNLAELKSANPVRRMLKGMERGIHIYNQTFDLISSLSTYMALVEKGITPERAAAAVLDTMNFRKKGSWMPNLKAMFPFIQPGVTSGIQLLGSLYNARTGKINMTGMVQFAGYTLLFLALRQMARMATGDDKGGNKIDQLSEYEKLHNVLLPLGDRVLPIPITFGLPLATSAVANGIIDGVSGNKKLSEVGINIAKDAIIPAFGPEVNNIDPTQDFSAWLITQLSPAGVEPLVRIATNKDSMGRDIINKKSIKADVFMSEQGRVTTAPFFHSLARWLRSTGFVDPAPEQVREGWNSIMLGNLKELSQALITNPHLEEAGYETKTPMSMWHNLRGNITQQAINFSKMTDKIKAKQATGEKLDNDEKKMLTLWENYDKMDSARRKLIADVKKENISDVAKAKRIQRINKSYENRTADYVGRARSIWN